MSVPRELEERFRTRFHEYLRTLDCVHCGLCIPYCPTHEVTGREADSPRGRIYLMRGWAEGSLELTEEAMRHLDQCIVCRACEAVCPSGIRMGEMMESFRHDTLAVWPPRGLRARLGRRLLRHVIPSRKRIAALTDALWLFQAGGLERIARAVARRWFPALERLFRLTPRVPPPRERRLRTSNDLPGGAYRPQGPVRLRAGLFLGCIASEWFAPVHRATIRVLQRNGCEVVVPEEQTCCGALHRHAGFLEDSAALFERNAAAFREAGVDVVVVNAAGCGAALKEPPEGFEGGLGAPVRDVLEFLDEVGIVEPQGEVRARAVYDQPCHLLYGQGIDAGVAERLLAKVRGLELLPLRDSERCCGSGGVYNLLHPELAEPILAEKVQAILEARPDFVLTANPGCALQIRSGLEGTGIEVFHVIEILDRAYRGTVSG